MMVRNRTPKDTPTPTPIFSASFSPEEDVLGVVKGDDREDVEVCAVNDTLEATAVADTEADEEPVVEGVTGSDSDDAEMIEIAIVASAATVGTSDWTELSVAPGVEHPTPPPLPLTAI